MIIDTCTAKLPETTMRRVMQEEMPPSIVTNNLREELQAIRDVLLTIRQVQVTQGMLMSGLRSDVATVKTTARIQSILLEDLESRMLITDEGE